MNLIKILVTLTAGFVIFPNTVFGKERTCRLVFPDRPQTAPKSAFLFDGTKSHAITLPSMNLSDVVKLPPGELTIALAAENITDAKLLSPNLPTLKIPEDVVEFYIVLHPDLENKEFPIKMDLVDAGDSKLKVGETLWCNFTKHRIAAKLGKTEMTADPNSRTVSTAPEDQNGYYVAKFTYQLNGEGEFLTITEQSWFHDAKSKHLGFIISTNDKLPKIFFFRDFRVPEN